MTPATDVYSLGVVLYELLTGAVPFPGDNFVAVAMKHINEPPPSVLEQRPDVPVRLVHAVERALAKSPTDRFPTMDAFAAELRVCLADVGEPDDARTFILPSPVVKESLPRRARARRSRRPLYAVLLLVAAALAVAAAVVLSHSNGPARDNSSQGSGGEAPVSLTGARAYDPYGTGGEHDPEAPNAIDGNPGTYWETEHYDSGLGKPGVGLVLDAGAARALSSLTVTSDTPGFTATITSGSSATGPFTADSSSQRIASRTTFPLAGHRARYYVVWITNLGAHSSVHVNEVTARG